MRLFEKKNYNSCVFRMGAEETKITVIRNNWEKKTTNMKHPTEISANWWLFFF